MEYLNTLYSSSSILSIDAPIFYIANELGVDLSKPINFFDKCHLYKSGLFFLVLFFIFWIIFHGIIHFISSYIACRLFPISNGLTFAQKLDDDLLGKQHSTSELHKRSVNQEQAKLSTKDGTSNDDNGHNEAVSTVMLKRVKFNIAFWKAIHYLFLICVGFKVLCSVDWIAKYNTYAASQKVIDISTSVYYHLAITSYLYGSYCLLREPKLKDFYVMISHHLVTLSLLVGSYYILGSVRIGMIVMILHDVCDPWMEIAKVCLYSKLNIAANFFFLVFSICFVVSRCILYPRFVIYPLFFMSMESFHNHYIAIAHGVMLGIIFIMDVYWTFLILEMIYTQILNGTLKGDVRENIDEEGAAKEGTSYESIKKERKNK